jgi:hypothetical protein
LAKALSGKSVKEVGDDVSLVKNDILKKVEITEVVSKVKEEKRNKGKNIGFAKSDI